MTTDDCGHPPTPDPTTLSLPPSWLQTPPSSHVVPPVSTRAQELPFGSLSWENFERLCLRLASRAARVEHCQLYGIRGQDQEGIDLYARPSFGAKYRVYQCKKEKTFGPAKIKTAVEKFLKGKWIEKTDTFVLCTQESLEPTALAEELERQTSALREKGITLLTWDNRQLSIALKQLPEIVDDFFGREWVREFCGDEQADRLGDRLDVAQIVEFRREMGRFYAHVFNVQDPGLLISDTPGAVLRLEDRYIVPDIHDSRRVEVGGTGPGSQDRRPQNSENGASSLRSAEYAPPPNQEQGFTSILEGRRIVADWIAANDRTVILGGPGSGKSTLLRFLAIDLLSEEPRLAAVAQKWGTYLPVWVPFPRWTKLIAETGPSVSLTDMLRQWLIGWDEGRLWPLVEKALQDRRLLLLVDGLDEWTNEEAAGIALDKLRVFVEQRGIPAILASRPHGFRRLGLEHAGWEVGELADFTPTQQKSLARIWYACRLACLEGEASDSDDLGRRAEAASEEFLVELAGSPDFQELAKVPLLLCLLILQRMHDGYLPTNRFKAYEQLVDLLTAKHPARRRKAAEIPNAASPAISDEETKQILAHLAYHIHTRSPEGLIDQEEARTAVREYLRDPDQGFGFAERNARSMAVRMLDVSVETTGILVSRSQSEIGFFHRSAQEYLAACHLAELPLKEQVRVVEARCSDPQWREVLLCLFHLIRRQEDVQSFADAIRAKSSHPVDRMAAELLLAETAFGGFNCPNALARDIASSAFEQIEMGSWMPQREGLLQRALDGLRSAKARGMVEAKVPQWFLNRLAWRPGVFKAMAGWSCGTDVLDCLLRGLHDEDVGVQRSAAKSIVDLAKCDPAIGERVADAARHADNPKARAAAVQALSNGWPNHVKLPEILDAARWSVAPELRVAAIAARIMRGEQTEDDRKELLFLGSRKWDLDYYWYEDVPEALLQGWPRDESVKRACLDSADRFRHAGSMIDPEFALRILLEGYPGDEEIAAFCVDELGSEHPFLMIEFKAWQLLAQSFRDHPRVVEAVDEWVATRRYDEPQIAMAAMVGRTDAMKRTLLAHLDDSSVPHWAAEALLEGWGMGDAEVASKLLKVALGSAERASRIGPYLPKIIADKAHCRERLLSILKAPECSRADFVLQGLQELGTRDDVEAVDIIIGLLPERPKWRSGAILEVYGHVIQFYSWDPRIRDLAKQVLAQRDGNHVSVATVYGGDLEIRREILQRANPLPVRLRGRIARSLKPGAGSDEFLLSILRLYDHEPDDSVKTEASIACHHSLRSLGKVAVADLEALREAIAATGPDYPERRRAAFAGLVALHRIGEFEAACDWQGSQPHLTLKHMAKMNLPLLHFILQHWQDTRHHCMDAFRNEEGLLWDMLCILADEYPGPRDEAIRFFQGRADTEPTLNELRFLARTLPGSGLLLDKCMKTLQIAQERSFIIGSEVIAASEIIGSQFSQDEEVYRRIAADCTSPSFPYVAIMALCEGWPESPELKHVYNPGILEGRHSLVTLASAVRLACLKATTEEIEKMIGGLLMNLRTSQAYDAIVPPILRRLRSDDDLASRLAARLCDRPSPSEKATLPRLLASSRGMSPNLKSWILAEIDRQVGTKGLSEIGFDLVSGANRAVWHVLMDTLR
jgi:energy-coupling factor transporter ATP-binding protein EcfA2